MLRLLAILLFLAPFGWAALWLVDHPGHLAVDWFGYRIETLTSVAIFLLLGLFFLFWALLSLIHSIVIAPKRMRRRIRERRRDRGLEALTQAFSALAIGDMSEARRATGKARGLLEAAPITLLLSSQLARAEGNMENARPHLEALLSYKPTEFLATRGLVENAILRGNLDEAREHAEHAFRLRPDNHWAAMALLDLYCRRSSWSDALDVVERARHKGGLSRPQARRYQGILDYERARAALERGEQERCITLLHQSLKSFPDFMPAFLLLAERYAATRQRPALTKLVQTQWKQKPYRKLATIYFDAWDDEAATKFRKRFEKLASLNPDDPESQIARASAAIHTAAWEEARTQLKVALSKTESAHICEMMAEVEKGEHGEEADIALWLKRAVSAPPEAGWVCDACGTTHENWTLHCGHCGTFDSIVWRAPQQKFGEREQTIMPAVTHLS